ncbi:MAG: hypothetical protein AAF346_01015 [Pseudomonadota bacterium]
MEIGLGILTFGTLGFGLLIPYLNIRALQKLKESDAPKSSLSRDGIEERLASATAADR